MRNKKIEKDVGIESSVLRDFNVCPMDRPTNRPTDRHDLLSLDDDTQQNQIDIYDKWANSSILTQVQ